MSRRPLKPSDPLSEENRRTRNRLLEAAGEVFAEEGFDRATGKAICERAGVNPAAINYHFSGLDSLYTEVLQVAHDRLLSLEAVARVVGGKTEARAKLQAVFELIVASLTGPLSESWAVRVLAREIVGPSPAFTALRENQVLPKTRLMRLIVAELAGLPPDHPAVARAVISSMAPCFMLLIADRSTLQRLFPEVTGRKDPSALAAHLVTFALAGIAAIASEAKQKA